MNSACFISTYSKQNKSFASLGEEARIEPSCSFHRRCCSVRNNVILALPKHRHDQHHSVEVSSRLVAGGRAHHQSTSLVSAKGVQLARSTRLNIWCHIVRAKAQSGVDDPVSPRVGHKSERWVVGGRPHLVNLLDTHHLFLDASHAKEATSRGSKDLHIESTTCGYVIPVKKVF
jgi:hypothetical protein